MGAIRNYLTGPAGGEAKAKADAEKGLRY